MKYIIKTTAGTKNFAEGLEEEFERSSDGWAYNYYRQWISENGYHRAHSKTWVSLYKVGHGRIASGSGYEGYTREKIKN